MWSLLKVMCGLTMESSFSVTCGVKTRKHRSGIKYRFETDTGWRLGGAGEVSLGVAHLILLMIYKI